MRYAEMRSMDVSNGVGIGISLFVQGCHFHCKDCFNSSTWDFSGGKKWTEQTKDLFLSLADKPYISRISILGGEPLSAKNLSDVYSLIREIKTKYPKKKIWLYTGYKYEDLNDARREVVKLVDVLIDGQFDTLLKDLNLPFCGSSNQRVIDIKKTLNRGVVTLYI